MLETKVRNLSSPQSHELRNFGSRVNRFGANFAVCNVNGELVLVCDGGLFRSDRERLIRLGMEVLGRDSGVNKVVEEGKVLTSVLACGSEPAGYVGLIDLGEKENDINNDERVKEENPPGYCTRKTVLSEMLSLFAENFHRVSTAEKQIEIISSELSETYEELMLLHKLSTHMKVTEPDSNFLQMACDSLTDLVSVEGIAILLEKTIDNDKKFILVAGSGLLDIDDQMAAMLYSRLLEELNSGREAILDSEVDSPFKYDWPANIKNVIAVPLLGKTVSKDNFIENCFNTNNLIGLMVAINIIGKADFDSVDAKLFYSVANSCAVFIENGKLFMDLQELFIGALKSLTSSIDAKDEYTRGHSERVAFVSRWIAERLSGEQALSEEQIRKVYLAGLLHDIGKLGIDEAVLRKKGKLTNEELDCIKRHPRVGADILGGIKQMHDIVPGVLYHHERIDGKGYPDGLTNDEIPLIGKILSVADSFDAMTSKRTYREAMTVEQSLEEIEKCARTQFDENVSRVFLDSDVYYLWSLIQEEFAEDLGTGNLSQYGALAVGTLIR
jgi:HD-GYP domain-containing protein (c-di-GMP phosphodiesterase class II)